MAVATQSKSFFREPSTRKEKPREEPRRESPRLEAPLLGEERVTQWKRELTPENARKLARIVDREMSRMGYSSYREGSRTHLATEARVISNLVFHEVDWGDINFEEESPRERKSKGG